MAGPVLGPRRWLCVTAVPRALAPPKPGCPGTQIPWDADSQGAGGHSSIPCPFSPSLRGSGGIAAPKPRSISGRRSHPEAPGLEWLSGNGNLLFSLLFPCACVYLYKSERKKKKKSQTLIKIPPVFLFTCPSFLSPSPLLSKLIINRSRQK